MKMHQDSHLHSLQLYYVPLPSQPGYKYYLSILDVLFPQVLNMSTIHSFLLCGPDFTEPLRSHYHFVSLFPDSIHSFPITSQWLSFLIHRFAQGIALHYSYIYFPIPTLSGSSMMTVVPALLIHRTPTGRDTFT